MPRPGVIERSPCDPKLCVDEDLVVCADETTGGLCDAAPVQPVGYPWCEGDVLVVCSSLYTRSRRSCRDSDPDFTCVPNEACDPYGSACETASGGMPPGTEQCVPGALECVGSTLRYCEGGKQRSFDCSVMRGATCVDRNCVLP